MGDTHNGDENRLVICICKEDEGMNVPTDGSEHGVESIVKVT